MAVAEHSDEDKTVGWLRNQIKYLPDNFKIVAATNAGKSTPIGSLEVNVEQEMCSLQLLAPESPNKPITSIEPARPQISLEELKQHLREGNAILAIKCYRYMTGLDLRTCKDYIDNLRKEMGV